MTYSLMRSMGPRIPAVVVALAPAIATVWWAFPDRLPPWRSVAIVSAWAGCALLMSSLVLMVREPRVARMLGGLENTYRWHHRSGIAAYLLLLIHPLALACEGWTEAPALAWQVLNPWAQSWPVWLGWASLLLLMFGLATTFALHLPYRRWRALHLVLGLGVVLGLLHVHALLGGSGPLLALIVAAAIALGWRLIASDLGASSHPYRVTAVAPRAHDMVEATLAPCATALAVTPGQFVLAAFGHGPRYRGCGEYHPFTVSGIEADHGLRLSIKALGPCSRIMQSLEPGVVARLQGPFGTFLDRLSASPQLWVAGGIGITPFVAALRAGPCTHPTTLIYLYKTQNDAAFIDELAAMAAADTHLELLTEATGEALPDFSRLLSEVGRPEQREIWVCGPPAMVEMLSAQLRRMRAHGNIVHYESFDFR